MTDISVITINYREAAKTKEALKSLLKSKRVKFEVILLDNSCDENEAKIMNSITDRKVHVHIMKENVGVARGYNFGVEHAKGKYIFIINNDAQIGNSLDLFRMKKYLDTHPEVAVIQPKIKSIINRTTFDYAGASGGYIDIYGYPFCRGRLFQKLEDDRGQYDDIKDISWASTCAFFAKTSVIRKAGLFDPIYFAYAEEVDISMKIWGLGYKIQVYPPVSVYHYGESSWKKRRAKKTFLIHRNHLILFYKCFSDHEVRTLTIPRLLHEAASVGFYIVTLRPHLVIPIIQAYAAVIKQFGQIQQRRKIFFQNYRENSMPMFRKSITINHFLLRKQYFSELNLKYLYNSFNT